MQKYSSLIQSSYIFYFTYGHNYGMLHFGSTTPLTSSILYALISNNIVEQGLL